MIFDRPLSSAYRGAFMVVGIGDDLAKDVAEVSDKWRVVVHARVTRFSKHTVTRELANAMGWPDVTIGRENTAASCELLSVLKGTSEVEVGDSFEVLRGHMLKRIAEWSDIGNKANLDVWLGFDAPLTSRPTGRHILLRILEEPSAEGHGEPVEPAAQQDGSSKESSVRVDQNKKPSHNPSVQTESETPIR